MRPPEPRPVDRSDRRRWAQLLLGIILFVVAELVMVAVARLGTVATGASFAQGPAGWALLLGAGMGAAVAMGGFLLILGPLGRSPGLALRGAGKLAELALGLVIGAALISLSVGLIALLGGYRVTGFAPSPQLLVPLALGIGAGFIEEILFRGILLRLLDAWLGSWAALAITSLLFGLIHLTNDGASVLTALGLVIEAGVLLGAAYLLTRRLWLAIGVHIAWNTVQAGVFSSTVSGTGEQSGLLVAEMSGPAWLTGGSMGVEGSVVSVLLGLAAGTVLLVIAGRRGHLLPSVRTTQSVAGAGAVDRAEPAARGA
ncbi:CPBP family intramembrane glutamic endopeptidase [Brachybacterium sacelli]|uniref:Membrane protease YdiL (CAAX protease family) n=1 Tax=Brachybacterium sacelli TaxID=173364 RepID=A0ABS4WWK9_9MICO|nr:type II CAAX endopeptidase family protein [Brachybacterium sacelli]MBP2380582.1 membrane protease YdiL (CAAX protease family) [Brachybacterium sacelli]